MSRTSREIQSEGAEGSGVVRYGKVKEHGNLTVSSLFVPVLRLGFTMINLG